MVMVEVVMRQFSARAGKRVEVSLIMALLVLITLLLANAR